MLLFLVHVLHTIRLEIIHRFSALKLLLLVLKLLEICHIWLLHLLLISLNYNVWSISSDENLGRYARVQLTSIFLDFLRMMTRLIVGQYLRLASTTIILHISFGYLCALNLADHSVRQAVGSNTQHSISPVSHRHRSVASVLLLPKG